MHTLMKILAKTYFCRQKLFATANPGNKETLNSFSYVHAVMPLRNSD